MTVPERRPALPDDGPPTRSPGPGHWLERLLKLAENSTSLVANTVLILVIVLSSMVISMLLAALLIPRLGLIPHARSFVLVGVIATAVPLLVGLPAVLFGDALIRKITAMREELREALTRATLANRAKSDFLANISHEIRTPMNGVLGMAQVLEGTPLTDAQREHLRLIRESGDMLMAIIDDVLDLSRIEAGRIDLNPAPHPLTRTLADTVGLFQARAAENGTTLAFAVLPGTPERAVFDVVRVRQCLGNLVSNAVKFTHDGTITVTLTARPAGPEEGAGTGAGQGQGHEVVLVVQDSGIGIPGDVQARLFAPFEQADVATGQAYGGTGLGLAISRRLARAMGGDITVTSTPGAGARFAFRFRAGPAPPEAVTGPVPAAPARGGARALEGLRVLVVDDSAVNRRVALGLLAPTGAVCEQAADGHQALAALAAQRFDLVLLDMQMPLMDGPATLAALRGSGQDWAGVPVIAMTAQVQQDSRAACLRMGMQGFVAKPVRQAALLAEIRASLPPGDPAPPLLAAEPEGACDD